MNTNCWKYVCSCEATRNKRKKDKPFTSYAYEIMRESSVTGVASILKSKGWCRKTIKFLILAFGLAGFIFQTSRFLHVYWKYTTMPSVIMLNTMKKPAITICDENLISRRYLCENRPATCDRMNEQNREQMTAFCTYLRPYCTRDDDELLKVPAAFVVNYEDDYYALNFTKESGFQIDENLLSCEWISWNVQNNSSGKSSTPCRVTVKKEDHIYPGIPTNNHPYVDLKSVFVRGLNFETLPGACYTLGSIIGESESEAETLNQSTRLKMTLKWKNSDWNNLSPDSTSLTDPKHRVYYIAFHNPAELVNPFLHGTKIQDRKHFKIKVSEIDIMRLPSPYATHCHDYIKEWKENGGKTPLKREDCMNKCAIDASYIKLGCVPRDIPYPHEKELCITMPPYDVNLDAEIEECAKECQEACFERRYTAKSEIVGQTTYSEAYDRYRANEEEAICISRVEIHFDILKSKIFTEKPKYESIELFSYIGGYLGMWLGWSLVAIFDFVEILFRILKYPFKINRRQLVIKKRRNSIQAFLTKEYGTDHYDY